MCEHQHSFDANFDDVLKLDRTVLQSVCAKAIENTNWWGGTLDAVRDEGGPTAAKTETLARAVHFGVTRGYNVASAAAKALGIQHY